MNQSNANRSVRALVAILALIGASVGAQAASISITQVNSSGQGDPEIIVPDANGLFTLSVVMDFTDNPTIGGGFDLVYDSEVFELDQLTNNGIGGPIFTGGEPDFLDGVVFNWHFGSFNPITGPDEVGTVTFRYLGGAGTISLRPTDGISGPFIASDFVSQIDVEYNAMRVVPLPSAIWFFATALGALVTRARIAKTVGDR